MEKVLTGKVYVFGDNIDTDQIYPGSYLELTEIDKIAEHCMEGADPLFSKKFERGGIIIARNNFGCGSSREHAAITLKEIGVAAIVAESFSRIFYRNAINLGLPLVLCKDVGKYLTNNDVISLNLETGELLNHTLEMSITCEAIDEYAMEILDNGGIVNMLNVGK